MTPDEKALISVALHPLQSDIQMLELMLAEIPSLQRLALLGDKEPAVRSLALFEKHLPAVIEAAKAALDGHGI